MDLRLHPELHVVNACMAMDEVAEDVVQVASNGARAEGDQEDIITEKPEDLSVADEGPGFLWESVKWSFFLLVGTLALLILCKLWIWWRTRRRLQSWGYSRLPYRPIVVGFFHPYCGAAGGGERVLWHSIHALQKRYSFVRCVVFTGDRDMTPKQILDVVKQRFKISLITEVEFVYLKWRGLVEAGSWPHCTILGQSLGSFLLGLEALWQLAPHVYIDTTGHAFTLPLFRWLGGCKVASYVHYPTVSSDMLRKVGSQIQSFNNSRTVSRSRLLTRLKLCYYRIFACVYGFVGRRSDVVMVNSSWTHAHIRSIWNPDKLFIVYPPCDTSSFESLPLSRPSSSQHCFIASLSQFRPEKNHRSQLRILAELVKAAHPKQVTLVLIGSCRNKEDQERVEDIRHLAEQLQVLQNVEFKVNVRFEELKAELGRAVAAIHTMENEHFGISLVECMAAGCLMVAHNSGGPRHDIVVDVQGRPTGFLADTEDQFVSFLLEVLQMEAREREEMAATARDTVSAKFSLDVFEASFLRATEKLFG